MTEGDLKAGGMSDGGRENKRRCIRIRRDGEEISYGWCKRETRGAGRAREGCTLHLSVQQLYCIMYNFLMRKATACRVQHIKGQVCSAGDNKM